MGISNGREGNENQDVHWLFPQAGWAVEAATATPVHADVAPSVAGPSSPHHPPVEAVTDAILTTSRLLVGASARSFATIDESITIPQFRMLVVLYTLGPLKPSAVATILQVNPSNATRMFQRLRAAKLVQRRVNPTNRREVILRLTKAGAQTVNDVTKQRYRHIADIVERMPLRHRSSLVEALEAFNAAGGENPPLGITDDWV